MRRLPWWFLVPLLTFGFGSAPMVIYGGARLRSRGHVLAGIGYGALFIVFCTAVQFTEHDKSGPLDAVAIVAWLACWVGATAHAAVLQSLVWSRSRVAQPPVDPAVAAAQDRLAKRVQARELLASNPALAAELRIGRPDLDRQYEDGGLVDVNHVPAPTLATELGLPAEVAAEIVAARARPGGLSSPDELVVYCAGMTLERLNVIRDRLVFPPA